MKTEHLKPNSQLIQEPAEVTRTNTTTQPKQHTNNANAKCKKPQATPANSCTVNRTQQQTKAAEPQLFSADNPPNSMAQLPAENLHIQAY